MTNRAFTLVAAAAVVFGLTVPAFAQGSATTNMPTYQLSGGYQLLHAGKICDPDDDAICSDGLTIPFGLAVDAAKNFGALSVVAEGGWAFKSEDLFNLNSWHLAGGVRWTSRKSPTTWPYGQVLAGAVFDHVSPEVGDSNTETSFMLQPGFGVNFVAGDGWGIFGQVDYRRVFLDDTSNIVGASGRNDVRVFFGVRMILD